MKTLLFNVLFLSLINLSHAGDSNVANVNPPMVTPPKVTHPKDLISNKIKSPAGERSPAQRMSNFLKDFNTKKATGFSYKYVKAALYASGLTDSYVNDDMAKNACKTLPQHGFQFFKGSFYDAPDGALIVSAPVDVKSQRPGDIQIKSTTNGVTEYISDVTKSEPSFLSSKMLTLGCILVKTTENPMLKSADYEKRITEAKKILAQ